MKRSPEAYEKAQAVLKDEGIRFSPAGAVMFDTDTWEGRVATRAAAYAIIALGNEQLGNALLDWIGKHG